MIQITAITLINTATIKEMNVGKLVKYLLFQQARALISKLKVKTVEIKLNGGLLQAFQVSSPLQRPLLSMLNLQLRLLIRCTQINNLHLTYSVLVAVLELSQLLHLLRGP